MHIIVAWEVKGDAPPEGVIDKEIVDVLSGESYAKALERLYIVRIDTPKDRGTILSRLKEVAREHTTFVNLIVSPPIESPTRYDGWLPKKRWPEIRRRTHPPLVEDAE